MTVPDPHVPRYLWGYAPARLATRRQLDAQNLRPTADPVAMLNTPSGEVPLYDRRHTRRFW